MGAPIVGGVGTSQPSALGGVVLEVVRVTLRWGQVPGIRWPRSSSWEVASLWV